MLRGTGSASAIEHIAGCHTGCVASLGVSSNASISMRLKLYLLSDEIRRAQREGDGELVDRLLTSPRMSEEDVVEHLNRQMGLDYVYGSDLDGTLTFISGQLDERVRGKDVGDLSDLVDLAIRPLTDSQLIETAVAGLRTWKGEKISACTVGTLGREIRKVIARSLVTSITRLEGQWKNVDVEALYELREGAQERMAAREAEWRKEHERILHPPPVSLETESAQEEARKRSQRRKPEHVRKQVRAALEVSPSTVTEICSRRGQQLAGVSKLDVRKAVQYLSDLGRVTWDGALNDDDTVFRLR